MLIFTKGIIMDDEIIYKQCDICESDDNRPVYLYKDGIRRCKECAKMSTALNRENISKFCKPEILAGGKHTFEYYY